MKSQWDCLLENLGVWNGSFTRLSASGGLIEDVPSRVSFTQLEDGTMRQIVRLEPTNQPVSEKVLEYRTLGRNILFLDSGAFSIGSIQLSLFGDFGAELGLIYGDRRLRLVQIFNDRGTLTGLTLIREKSPTSETPERPPLQVEDLLGTWQGEATTIYPDWRTDSFSSTLKIWREGERLHQELNFGRTITTSALIEGSILKFDRDIQIVMLPDGASSNCPTHVKVGQPFVLEVGWLVQPDLRQRLIRSYSDKGEWLSLTLVTERKTN
jgi:hypothetical protein